MAIKSVVLETEGKGTVILTVDNPDYVWFGDEAIKVKDLISSINLLQAAWHDENPEGPKLVLRSNGEIHGT
jgi:hypothetical protein